MGLDHSSGIPLTHTHRPHVQISPLAPEMRQPAIQAWLQSTERDSREYLKALINDIGSVRTIHGIKMAAAEISKSGIK